MRLRQRCKLLATLAGMRYGKMGRFECRGNRRTGYMMTVGAKGTYHGVPDRWLRAASMWSIHDLVNEYSYPTPQRVVVRSSFPRQRIATRYAAVLAALMAFGGGQVFDEARAFAAKHRPTV